MTVRFHFATIEVDFLDRFVFLDGILFFSYFLALELKVIEIIWHP